MRLPLQVFVLIYIPHTEVDAYAAVSHSSIDGYSQFPGDFCPCPLDKGNTSTRFDDDLLKEMCGETTGCFAVAIRTDVYSGSSDPYAWFKGTEENPDRTSYFKATNGSGWGERAYADFISNDLVHYAPIPPDLCSKECNQTPACDVFVISPVGDCWLKSFEPSTNRRFWIRL